MNQHPLEFFIKKNLTPRDQQITVVDTIYENWGKYKYFALSLPTGVGKTYIATAIADSLKNAYIATSTLQLQDQYQKSWDEIVNLKGRGNYVCALNENFTVDAAPCTANNDLLRSCKSSARCHYYNQKTAALKARAMITNPVYLLYSTHCGFAKDEENEWVPRDTLIIDEAHNLENHLVSFAESDIDPKKLHEEFGVDTLGMIFANRLDHDYEILSELYQLLQDKALELKEKLDKEFPQGQFFGEDSRKWAATFTGKVADRVRKMNSKIYALDKSIQPLKIFFNTHETLEELQERWIVTKHESDNILKLAPIYGDFLFQAYFGKLSEKFVFLSATLGTKEQLCKEIGADPSEMLYIETDSPFDPELSPVIAIPTVKLSKDYYASNVGKLGKFIDEIMDIHANERGIIHAVTYDIQKNVFNDVKRHNQKRLLCRDMDELLGVSQQSKWPKRYKNDELLGIHESEDGASRSTVLLSPSMMEGVDLHDDLSTFQIMIKLPWANLGDTRVRIKSKLDDEWYVERMWLNILQACGRSTRHETDTSITYILDPSFEHFLMQRKHKLPAWFLNRIIY